MCEIKAVPDEELKDNECRIIYECRNPVECVHSPCEKMHAGGIIHCGNSIAHAQALTRELRRVIGDKNAEKYIMEEFLK